MRKSVRSQLASKILYEERWFNRSDQTQYERDIFADLMLRLNLKNIEFESPSPPQPDIILSLYNSDSKVRKIGCELTDLYWDNTDQGSLQKQKIAKWKNFSTKLQDNLRGLKKGYEYIYGVLSLKNFNECLKSDNDLIDELINILTSHKFPFKTKIEDFKSSSYLKKHCNSLSLTTYPESDLLWWESSLLSGKLEYEPSVLNKPIIKKHKKDHDFSGCEEKWLLIYAGGNNLGNTITFFEEELKNVKYSKNKFDRIIYWDCFLENIFQLYPKFKILIKTTNNNSIIQKNNLPEIITKNIN
ncbi:hypothetical protein [Gracilimonas sediminicola]|uniref:Uncharacterized protein n=1 Tax=Gracilimonas sediminicola TaxID=2952158 RepID=A0A9X2L5F5_9BACT|nr:hypothetical protein [Gracilimonas sediminicola]MCP9292725.1 hypothetical protein [Gracilimonas sediminicola]